MGQIFKKTAKEFGMNKLGKALTKQGCLAEPGKKVHDRDKKGPSSSSHDKGYKRNGLGGKSAGFA